MDIFEILDQCPKNQTITMAFLRAYNIINDDRHERIVCSISGGSDSDIVLDMCQRCDVDKKIDYVFFDTGLEYRATKKHLVYLEQRYGVEIKQERGEKVIPQCAKKYGQPFVSKYVSEMMERLQKHDFQWENEPLEKLQEKYENCVSALRWWCNYYDRGKESFFNISRNRGLKEFITENPPDFKISAKCCQYTKKNVIADLIKNGGYQLNIFGVRKAEGGIRTASYKNCFDEEKKVHNFRPIFWLTDDDKKQYENHFKIIHSDCYTKYGFKRTGCAGCPFGRKNPAQLESVKEYEPNMYKAAWNVFGDSYRYTIKYREFIDQKKKEFEETEFPYQQLKIEV